MLSLNEKLGEVQLLRIPATFHALPLFYLPTQILRRYAGKNPHDTGNQPILWFSKISSWYFVVKNIENVPKEEKYCVITYFRAQYIACIYLCFPCMLPG